jgi:hypothetical protein
MNRRAAVGLLIASLGVACASVAPSLRAEAARAPATDPAVASRELASLPGDWSGIDEDAVRPLAASVYSLPSSLVTPAEAAALLDAVRAADPGRELFVVADEVIARSLASRRADSALHLVASGERAYSPWPRDPFFFGRGGSGEVLVVLRPNRQAGREEDNELALELLRALQPALDRAWGTVRWTRATAPFHNGQVLLTPAAAWVSLHALEERALELLELAAVPVESFRQPAGIDRYLGAADRAAAELARLYGRPLRYVHPWPTAKAAGSPAAQTAVMRRLGGGAGFDLDSLVTVVPVDAGAVALVGDLAGGRRLLAGATPAERTALASAYGIAEEVDASRAILAASESPTADALAGFLDLVAEHLASSGAEVSRLPLLLAPVPGGREGGSVAERYFVLGWNNVVLETRHGRRRAEGFSSLWPAGDAAARAAYRAAGVELDLYPPLVGSVVRSGGYRCASNHLRQWRAGSS